MKKIILNLGVGTLTEGYQAVIGEVLGEPVSSVPKSGGDSPRSNSPNGNSAGSLYPSRFTGQLPPAPELSAMQQQWQQLYYARNQDLAFRIHLLQREGIRYSASALKQHCANLIEQLNHWLDSPEFLPIDRALRRELARTDSAQIILETSDPQVQKLPWHLWQLLEAYPYAELTFSVSDWRPLPPAIYNPSSQLRVLAAFGSSDGLDLTPDLTTLNSLSDSSKAELSVLESPSLNHLHEQLWQPQGWDIFFFAGHSETQGTTGVIDLNPREQLTIEQLKFALSKAIKQGLKIAIFNSCDGLGLAQQLSELQIPYIVVMREPVPDPVAQQFLQYLLAAFVAGEPFHVAVGEARQRLAGLDTDVPCASWLPVVWQNPTASAIYWQDLQRQTPKPLAHARTAWRALILNSCIASGIVLAVRLLGLLEPLELAAYDHLLYQRPIEPMDRRVVVVEISEESTSKYGYPLPDKVLTNLIDRITQGEPLAIGLDLHRAQPKSAQRLTSEDAALLTAATKSQSAVNQPSEPATPAPSDDYDKFLHQVKTTSNLFLVCSYSSPDENFRAPLQLSEQMRIERVGFSDLPVDVSTIGLRTALSEARGDLLPSSNVGLTGARVRRQLLSYEPDFSATPSTCITPYSFSFQLAFEYLSMKGVTPLEVTPDHNWKFGSVVFRSLPQRTGGYQSLETPSSQILLNYRAGQPAQKVSVEQLMSGSFDLNLLRDRLVLIGYSAPVSKDYFETPYGPMSGLWIHTHMVSQMISAVLDNRPLIHTLPRWGPWQWGDMLWIFAWSGLAGYTRWALQRRNVQGIPMPTLWLLIVGLNAVLLYGTCWLSMVTGLWLPLVPGGLAALGAVIDYGKIPNRLRGGFSELRSK